MTEGNAGRRLDWDETAAALTSTRPWISPAELHGLLCGSVCAGGEAPGDDAWLQRVWQHAGEDLADGADHAELIGFRERALGNLEADDFGFDLLLPDEETLLRERVSGLASWCAGFLSGFGLGGGRTDGMEEDALTALRDMAAIAGVDAEVDDDDGDESDFSELVEYVRMGVLVILTGSRAADPANDAPEPLH
jgi:uncharacterized protein YgfB (UPF0149 family)